MNVRLDSNSPPLVIADGPLAAEIVGMLDGQVELRPWPSAEGGVDPSVDALYTYGHPRVDAPLLDRLPGLRVISNYGVGVDHIDVDAAAQRRIPVGNTPGVLDEATADMALALLMAAARRLIEGDRYARSGDFLRYDPGFMLGREIHHATLGILGLGRIGWQIARRARGFDMAILYHNRRRRPDAESQLGARYVEFDQLLAESDYLVISTPLTEQTRGRIGRNELQRMKPTATLINVARGPIVQTAALTEALQQGWIGSAALDVTDPEPLPRDHPLLQLPNLVIAPHLGSATVQTRRKMAEISVENLFRGLRGQPLVHRVES